MKQKTMRGKELREALKTRMQAEFAQNPELVKGKKLTGILLLVWVVSRVFLQVMELMCMRIGFLDPNPTNWVILGLLLLFAWAIYKGSGTLAWLPILGGVMMLITALRQQMFSLLGMDLYPEFRLYLIGFLAAAVLQILTMALILALPSCRSYAKTSMAVMKELSGQQDVHRL